MTAPVTVREPDLRALAGIVSEDRPDLPDGEGLPLSLLADLMGQIRCDGISLERHDSARQETGFLQLIPVIHSCAAPDLQPVHWQHYWHCQPRSYPDRTGDLRSIVKITDFYSARQWHSTGMYTDIYRPQGVEHELQVFLPDPAGLTARPGRTLRLFFSAGPGRISPGVTVRCSRCCARTYTRPISTPNAAATPPPAHPPALGVAEPDPDPGRIPFQVGAIVVAGGKRPVPAGDARRADWRASGACSAEADHAAPATMPPPRRPSPPLADQRRPGRSPTRRQAPQAPPRSRPAHPPSEHDHSRHRRSTATARIAPMT